MDDLARPEEPTAIARPASPSSPGIGVRLRAGLRTDDWREALWTLVADAALIAITVGAKWLLLQATGANAGFSIYIPAVALAAWYRGLLGGILATVLSALVDTLLFLPALAVVLVDLQAISNCACWRTWRAALPSRSSRTRLRTERDRARSTVDRAHQSTEETPRPRARSWTASWRWSAARTSCATRSTASSVHELRTPITSIYGGAKLLARRDRHLAESVRRELIDDLEAEADRLYRLVEDLLVLAKSERGTVERATEPLLLSRIVPRVVRSEEQRWPAARFAVQAPNTLSPARGEETYVEQVLRNLLSNAAKYSPSGTTGRGHRRRDSRGRARACPGQRCRDSTLRSPRRLFELYYRSPATAGIGQRRGHRPVRLSRPGRGNGRPHLGVGPA